MRELVDRLADGNAAVRAALAAEPLTPPDILERLAGDRALSVRQAAAGNPSTPADALRPLLNTDNLDLLLAVGTNSGAPLDVRAAAMRRYETIVDEPRLLPDEMLDRLDGPDAT